MLPWAPGEFFLLDTIKTCAKKSLIKFGGVRNDKESLENLKL